MFIDTRTIEAMEKSLCSLMQTTIDKLYLVLEDIDGQCWKDIYFDSEIFANESKKYIEQQAKKMPDEVMFYHLSRRLNAVKEAEEGKNLKELLLTDNAFSRMLRLHGLTFSYDGKIIAFREGQKIQFPSKSGNAEIEYLRRRLGYNKQYQDYCFNGFALRDSILKNEYIPILRGAPEFISRLAEYIGDKELVKDYMQNSEFCCFTYVLPIEQVIFDKHENLNGIAKVYYLITKCFERLIERRKRPYFINDYGNPMLRLHDNACMEERWFVEKEAL